MEWITFATRSSRAPPSFDFPIESLTSAAVSWAASADVWNLRARRIDLLQRSDPGEQLALGLAVFGVVLLLLGQALGVFLNSEQENAPAGPSA